MDKIEEWVDQTQVIESEARRMWRKRETLEWKKEEEWDRENPYTRKWRAKEKEKNQLKWGWVFRTFLKVSLSLSFFFSVLIGFEEVTWVMVCGDAIEILRHYHEGVWQMADSW